MGHAKVRLEGDMLVVETDYENAGIDHKFIHKSVLKNVMKAYGINKLEAFVRESGDGSYAIKEAFDEEFKKTRSRGYFETFGMVEL